MANAFLMKPAHGTRQFVAGTGGVTIVGAGTGYSDGELVTVSGGGGYDAVLTIAETGGVIDTVTTTDAGHGFTSTPTLTFATGNADATGTANLTGGVAADTNLEVYTVPALTTAVVIGLTVSNQTSSAIAVTIIIEQNGNSTASNRYVFAKDIPIPASSSLEIMSGNKINLETTDTIFVRSNVDYSFDVIASIMEIS